MSTSTNDEHFRNALYSWPEIGLILLYENFYQKLLRIADMYTRDRQSSEDVLQEVFIDIWRRHKEVGGKRDEHIEKYLVKAVQYRSITHYRKRARMEACESAYYYLTADASRDAATASPSEAADDQALMKLIAGTFPLREQQCLLLRMEGLTIQEIADRLKVTRRAVEKNLARARTRFRRFGSRFYNAIS